MHIAFRDGYADRDYMAEFADVPEEMEAHLKDKTPEWAAEESSVPDSALRSGVAWWRLALSVR